MRAVADNEECTLAVEQDRRTQTPTEVIVRLTSTAICGSDLQPQIWNGYTKILLKPEVRAAT
jgi:threonine dehydrogenase-like Zn-dependent dehydrogenase